MAGLLGKTVSVVREEELSGVRLSMPARWTLSSTLWVIILLLLVAAMAGIGFMYTLVELWALALVPAAFLILQLLTWHTHRPATITVNVEAVFIERPRIWRWFPTTQKIPLCTITRSRLMPANYGGEGSFIQVYLDNGEAFSFGFGHQLEGLRQISEELSRALRIHDHAPAERGSAADIPKALAALRETP